jgi:hypothetical protein
VACKECPVRAQCTKSPFRKLLISVNREVPARAGERFAALPGAMRQRAGLVEHPFGTIKERHGHGGLLCCGIALAGAEMATSGCAYNFTQVVNLIGAEALIEVIRARMVVSIPPKHPSVEAVLAILAEVLAAHGGGEGIRLTELLESAVSAP